MRCVAGFAVAGIFHMHYEIEQAISKDEARQPNIGSLKAEDCLYLLPLVTLFDQLIPFLLFVLREYLLMKKS